MPHMRVPSAGVFYALLGAVFFGTTGTIQAFAPPGSQPLIVGGMRMLVGGTAMLVWLLVRQGIPRFAPWPRRVTLVAAGGVVLFQILFFSGLIRTGVAVGTVVAIGCSPIAGGLLDYGMRGIKPGRYWYAATALALCGLGLLSFDADVQFDPVGVAMALGAGC